MTNTNTMPQGEKPAMTMNHVPVKSSTIKSIAHDPENAILQVKFHSGSTYQYGAVPADVHARFMRSTSPGSFLHANIIGRYPSKKLN